jgi:DNA-binding transcriptional MerR regulator
MSPRRPVKKLFRIGEVAEYSGLSRQTVNYYTVLGILREAGRTRAGHRLYDESVFDRIERVRKLKAKHTLREIADLMRREDRGTQREKASDGKDS